MNDRVTLDLFAEGTEEDKAPVAAMAAPEEPRTPLAEAAPEDTQPLPSLLDETGHGGEGGGHGGGGVEDEGDYHPLGEYAEHAYLAYAMSVVKGRAIPDVSDGLKHVQRRILYAMHQLGVTKGTKPVKSARVVGEVLGKWHPHSDQAAYDAMVRLAQDFSMRYPLIDGEGNFGSRDGDSAAAMRYTEAKLSELSELLLSEIDQGTVEFVPNYDGTLREPRLLPARLPMILLNGQTGIGVGMATETPPHNMREVATAAVALLKKPSLSVAELMEHIKGPDFPGGGQIISSAADILSAYESGRGGMRMRARWEVEQLARGHWRIVINELPHGVSANQIIEEIGALTDPQAKKGEKDISAAQKNLKQLFLNLLDVVRDESDKDHPVRLVLEPKSSRQKPDEFMQAFLVNTSLEVNYAMNLVVIGIDGKPTQKNLREILSEWLQFRFETVTRRTQHRLNKVEDRIHILEGRQIVLLNIDEVIRIIRNSDEPKADLMAAFKLSERQAEDILEIRLRQLARLEAIKIEQELKDLRAERETLVALLGDAGLMKKLIIKEIKADAEKFGDDRRTVIETTQAASFTQSVVNEPVTVILSEKGWVRSRSGHGIDLASQTYKNGDQYLAHVETRSVDQVVFLDDRGRAYSVAAATVPGGRGEGVPLATMLDLPSGARIVHMLAGKPEQKILFANSGGYGFVAHLSDLISRLRAGKAFMTLEDKEQVLAPVPVQDLHNDHVAAVAEDSHLLVFPVKDVKVMSKGRGVMLMSLARGQQLADVRLLTVDRVVLEGDGRSGKTASQLIHGQDFKSYLGQRGRRGHLLPRPLKSPRFARDDQA